MASKIIGRCFLFSRDFGVWKSLPPLISRPARRLHTQYSLRCRPSAQTAALESSQSLHISEEATTESINPLEHFDFFGVRDLVNMEELFEAGVHLGHKEGCRDDSMKPYLFGNRLGVDIFDLDKTVPLLQDALNFTAHIAFREGIILFISRHMQSLHLVEKAARDCGEYSHCREWKGGTFTNATTQFGAVTRLPDLCIFLCTQNNVFRPHIAITEAAKMNVPTIGIVDSSCDPQLITYPVPGNDDSLNCINLYCILFREAILKGKAKRKELLDQGHII